VLPNDAETRRFTDGCGGCLCIGEGLVEREDMGMRFIHILRRFGVVHVQTAIAAIRRALFAIVGQIWVVGSWLRLLPIPNKTNKILHDECNGKIEKKEAERQCTSDVRTTNDGNRCPMGIVCEWLTIKMKNACGMSQNSSTFHRVLAFQ